MPEAQAKPPPIARAAASASMPVRPRWLTVMATISLITALLWLLVALLIAMLLFLLRLVETSTDILAGTQVIDAAAQKHLLWMGVLDFVSGIWLLLAGVMAYRGRAVTRPLHNSLAGLRIVLLIVWLVALFQGPGSSFVTAGDAPDSPLALAAMGGLELIYPVVILIVFNKAGRREQLRILNSPHRVPGP